MHDFILGFCEFINFMGLMLSCLKILRKVVFFVAFFPWQQFSHCIFLKFWKWWLKRSLFCLKLQYAGWTVAKFHLFWHNWHQKCYWSLLSVNFPVFHLFFCKFGVFAVSVLVSGKIVLKSSQITALVKIHKILIVAFTAYILVYLVNTCSLICMHCTYCVLQCKKKLSCGPVSPHLA